METEFSHTGMITLSETVRFRPVGGEGVLIQLESGRVIVVNEVALRVLELLKAAPATCGELATGIVSEYEVDESRALKDVCAFLGELQNENVLSFNPNGEVSRV
jgi:hypothetical protein